MIEIRESTKEIEEYVMNSLSPQRAEHCRETALLALSLCERFGEDPAKGYMAGIAHDIARELDPDEITAIACSDGLGISSMEKEHPILLHGRVGAVIIRERYSIVDHDILDAVRIHTCGCAGMSVLASILYVSDFLEPSRNFRIDIDRESVLRKELLDMMIFVTEHKARFLTLKGRMGTDTASKLYDDLVRRKQELDQKTRAR
jgi:predicted HD superfamily hydrolase involved in NAD metabolism